MSKIDIIGKRFGKLVVLEKTSERIGYQNGYKYKVKCDCGTVKVMNPYTLTRSNNSITGCGCQRGESTYIKHLDKHCKREHDSFKYLQNLGDITKRWDIKKGGSFENFIKDMGEKPSDKRCLVRINRRQPYGPGNCKWGTRTDQSEVAYKYSEGRKPNSSGYHGVKFDYTNASFISSWNEKGRGQVNKRFGLGKYDYNYEEALLAAAQHTAKMRSRTSGRKITLEDLEVVE